MGKYEELDEQLAMDYGEEDVKAESLWQIAAYTEWLTDRRKEQAKTF